jgi:2'-5' RNA ligase
VREVADGEALLLRLFIAAFLPEETKDVLFRYAQSLRSFFRGVRWEPREKLHVTLRFLGDVDESCLEGISADVGSAVCGSGGVKSGFDDFYLFPGSKNPRVLALGLVKGEQFQFLFDKVQSAVLRNGFEMEKRKFIPHVTLGRIRGDFEGIRKIPRPDGTEFSITRIGIIQSELGPQGSRYTSLRTWNLQGGI